MSIQRRFEGFGASGITRKFVTCQASKTRSHAGNDWHIVCTSSLISLVPWRTRNAEGVNRGKRDKVGALNMTCQII
jgi:hypothetical protein